jgi:hypothetical protein
MEIGTTKWVRLLNKIAALMNSSSNAALPKGTTPNEIWFNRANLDRPEISDKRKRQLERRANAVLGLHDNPIETSSSSDNSESEISYDKSSDEETVLSRLHQMVRKSQDQYNQHMIKKKGGVLIKYRKGQVVLLKIPKKNRKNIEAERLPCRVWEIKNKVYTIT